MQRPSRSRRQRTPTPSSTPGVERSEPAPGIRLVTERMPHVRSVALGVWIDVGSRDEPDDLAGASHLLEHLLFKGTPRRSALEIAQEFDAVGGELNAYSAKEHTCVHFRVLDEDLAMAGDVVADMIGNALVLPEDLDAERKVVLEEIRLAADTPDDEVHDLFADGCWPGHPLGRPVLGTEESVGSLDRDRLYEFYRESYVPGRLVVSASGRLTHDDVVPLVSALAGERGIAPRAPRVRAAGVRSGAHYLVRSTEQVHLVWGSEGIPRSDPARYAAAVLSTLFGGGMSSRLFQEIRETRGLAYAVYSYLHHYEETGMIAVYAGTSEGSAREVLELTRRAASALAAGGAERDEVERAKGAVKGGLVLSMDDPGGRMSRLGRAVLLDGEVVGVDELLARVDAVTPDDVAALAARMFSGPQVLACVGQVAEGSLDDFVEPL